MLSYCNISVTVCDLWPPKRMILKDFLVCFVKNSAQPFVVAAVPPRTHLSRWLVTALGELCHLAVPGGESRVGLAREILFYLRPPGFHFYLFICLFV